LEASNLFSFPTCDQREDRRRLGLRLWEAPIFGTLRMALCSGVSAPSTGEKSFSPLQAGSLAAAANNGAAVWDAIAGRSETMRR
jgi:hypothetical protein